MMAVAGKIPTTIRRLIVAHPEDGYVRLLCRHFHRLGWRVYVASSGTVARRLARSVAPSVAILATHGAEESGWLTCAKLVRDLPDQKVVLVGNDPRPECRRLSKFVGGTALVRQSAGLGVLIDRVHAVAHPERSTMG